MPLSRHNGTSVLYPLVLGMSSLILLMPAALADHTDLFALGGVEYTVDPSEGNLNNCRPPGINDACSDVLTLIIDNENYNGDNSSFGAGGREALSDDDTSLSTLLTITRRTLVPVDQNWVRSLSIITNETLAPVPVNVLIRSSFQTVGLTVLGTSSGDTTAATDDVWMTLEADTNAARTGVVWGNGDGDAIDQISVDTVVRGGGSFANFGWDNVIVPPGETYIYMVFFTADVDEPATLATTTGLSDIADFNSQFQGLSTAEISQIQNWGFPDTDMDGMPDYFEENFGFDPNDDSDAALDADMDGLTNLEEFNNATDPTVSDTDADGLSDSEEVNVHGTDPNNGDTDDDGIGDGGEVNTAGDPLDPEDSASTAVAISSGEDAWEPRAAVDSAGNTHMAWVQDSRLGDPLNDFSYSGYEIYYSLLDPAGETLIAATRLTDNTDIDVRPRIAVDSMDRAVIAWQGSIMGGGNTTVMVRVDPATDDQNGDAADPMTLLGVGPVGTLVNGYGHITLALDGSDDIHLLGHNPCGSPLTYAKYDIDGAELIAEATVADNFNDCHANPDAAIDADGNVHVVYTHEPIVPVEGGNTYELHYLMIDGATGTKLIDETMLTVADGLRAKHPSVSVDAAGLLHVVYANSTPAIPSSDCQGGEIFRVVVDPSLDDQDGSAADPAVIRTVDPVMLSADDGRHSWYSWSDMNADGDIEITWNDGFSCRDGFGARGRTDELRRMVIDTDGNVVVPENTITEDATGGTGNRYTVVVGDRVFWSEFINDFDTIVTQSLGVLRLPTATATGDATLTNGTGLISSAEAVNVMDLPAEAQAMAPRNIDFVDGLFRIVIDTPTTGATVDLTINLPTPTDANTIYYKWDVVNGWQEFPYTQGATANDIVLSLTDGGAGDADGVANGQIVDPGGPGSNTNVAPVFTSMPVTAVTEGSAYNYAITTTDGNAGDTLTLAGTVLPGWLTLVDNGDGTGTLSGTPAAANVGANNVTIRASDNGAVQGVTPQAFVINVAALVPPSVPVTVGGTGGGSGSTTPWMLLVAGGLLLMRNRRNQKGAL